jgi:hypothetical protein
MLLLASLASHAQALGGAGDLRISGFGTLGILHSDAPPGWGYRRDLGQPPNDGGTRADIDSRLGVQANYAFTPRFELVAQLIGERRRSGAAAADNVEWAFAAFRPRPDMAIRIGRVNLDLFLMSEYQNVGFAYPFARPPVEFYGLLPAALDGADTVKTWNLDGIQWRLKGFAGRAVGGERGVAAEQIVAKPTYGVTLSRESGGLLLSASVARARVSANPAAEAPLLVALAQLQALPVPAIAAEAASLRQQLDYAAASQTYLALGTSFDHADWLAMAEAAHVSSRAAGSDLSAGYATLGHRFGPLTPFATVSRARSSTSPRSAPQWQAALGGAPGAQQIQALGNAAVAAANAGRFDQRTVGIGLRWDASARTALKLQADRVWVDPSGSALWTNATPQAAHASVLSLSLDFVF